MLEKVIIRGDLKSFYTLSKTGREQTHIYIKQHGYRLLNLIFDELYSCYKGNYLIKPRVIIDYLQIIIDYLQIIEILIERTPIVKTPAIEEKLFRIEQIAYEAIRALSAEKKRIPDQSMFWFYLFSQ